MSREGFLDQGCIPEPEMAPIYLITVMGLLSWIWSLFEPRQISGAHRVSGQGLPCFKEPGEGSLCTTEHGSGSGYIGF